MKATTQVAIIGAGPAGLFLGHLLGLEGIESIIVENRSREYVEHRVRAGVLEQGTVDLMVQTGVAGRLQREALVHHGIELQFNGNGHRIPLSDLAGGRAITIYGQQEVVKDLIAARLAGAGTSGSRSTTSSCPGSTASGPRSNSQKPDRQRPSTATSSPAAMGSTESLGPRYPTESCDNTTTTFHLPGSEILAAVAPSANELVYARHERGFALHSLRSPTVSRLYLQVDPGTEVSDWPDDRIWRSSESALRPAMAGCSGTAP